MLTMIQPNCRAQFAAEDIDFILSVLGAKIGTAECLVQLLADTESRDLILDDETLLRALLERGGCLRVSSRFYFYVLVRHAFRRADIMDRSVADYVAEVLAEFARADKTRCMLPNHPNPLDYFFEMLSALNSVDDRTRFYIRAHIGNFSLFMSGVFPDRIRFRAEKKGFPNLSYYVGLGRSHYRAAGEHRLAQQFDVANIYHTLADRFETTRLALNDVSERLFVLGEVDPGIERLLKEQNTPKPD